MTSEEGGITWERAHVVPSDDPDVRYWVFTTYGNPHLSPEGIAEVEKRITDPRMRDVKLYGKFVALAGLLVPQFRRELSMIDDAKIMEVVRSRANVYDMVWIDPHIKKETAILWCCWTKEHNLLCYRGIKK